MNCKLLLAAIAPMLIVSAAPAAAENFDGPYVGIQAGWNRAEVTPATVEGEPTDADVSQDSVNVGGYAGYNFKLSDQFVLGIEAGLSTSFEDVIEAEFEAQAGHATISINPRYSFDASLRAGYLIDAKTLAYARAGYANSRIRKEVIIGEDIVRASDNLDGWQVGGGVEHAIAENISARLEYRYTDFGNSGSKYDQHQALVGISYNF